MRLITDILREIRKGRVVDAASEELAAVVKDVLYTNKPGELTIKLKIRSQGKDDNAVIVSAVLSSKRPQEDLPEGIFFADLEGDLLRDDPTQTRMFADARETVDADGVVHVARS
jgi:hypothetical protein